MSRLSLKKHFISIVGALLIVSSVLFLPVLAAHAADAKKGKGGKDEKAAESGPSEPTEFTCESEIFYVWKSKPIPSPLVNASAKIVSEKDKERDEASKAEAAVPHREFFTRVGEAAESEVAAKLKLGSKLIELQGQALEHCKRRHQERAGCIMEKTREIGDEYARMDYGLRRSITDAIIRDCESVSGSCITPEATAIHCALTAGKLPPEVAAPAEAPAKKVPTAAPAQQPPAEEDPSKAPAQNPFNAPFSVQ